ncbi:MAG: bifunctional 5,10-methylenetetrahydrofolate dehydrogenase/5,10-methenyltetrahydrofolate cyclohydrolase [Mollicutes bacterium]|nr:bifunctional 5,10-methylenetetrahydrofolate dehydrogenase/5,10-methenyltetrahydrofolate cyclohydrolase [Mollicutes bacterium]
MIILDGKKLKEERLKALKNKIKDLKLSLAVIQIGNDEASSVYINQKKKACENLNVEFSHIKLEENITETKLLNIIKDLNNSDVTGILLQLPIPNHLNKMTLQNAIDYKKDVDGLNVINVNRLINNEKGLLPCTAKGIINMLKAYNIELAGKHVVIVGRSNLVGRPVSNLFLNENATVTICHSKTKNLNEITKLADILIAATGKKHLITAEMIKQGAIIVDVGINKIDGTLYGDVDYENVKEKTSYITPVPGGIGPMTICCLMENIYEAYLLQNNN